MNNTNTLQFEEPTHKTISIRTSTWKRIRRYGTYGSTLDSILVTLLDRLEGREISPEERSF